MYELYRIRVSGYVVPEGLEGQGDIGNLGNDVKVIGDSSEPSNLLTCSRLK